MILTCIHLTWLFTDPPTPKQILYLYSLVSISVSMFKRTQQGQSLQNHDLHTYLELLSDGRKLTFQVNWNIQGIDQAVHSLSPESERNLVIGQNILLLRYQFCPGIGQLGQVCIIILYTYLKKTIQQHRAHKRNNFCEDQTKS